MLSPAAIVLVLLAVCVLCFAINRPRMDAVALSMLPVLVLSAEVDSLRNLEMRAQALAVARLRDEFDCPFIDRKEHP